MAAGAPVTSIIVPADQAADTIARTLESVIRQTRQDWEAIVVDDGSRDDTAILAARIAATDPRIRLVRQANCGAAAARNRGLSEARGAWTLFLDADDMIDRRYLARMHRRLRVRPQADAVACAHVRLDARGVVIARQPVPRLDRDALAHCRRGPPVAIHAVLGRTALLRDLGGFDATLATNEDWDLWLRMAQAGVRFTIERRALAQYRCTPASLTRNGEQMLRDMQADTPLAGRLRRLAVCERRRSAAHAQAADTALQPAEEDGQERARPAPIQCGQRPQHRA